MSRSLFYDIGMWRACIFLSLVAVWTAVAWGRAADEGGPGSSLRMLNAGVVNYPSAAVFGGENRGDGVSEAIARLTVSGRPAGWAGYEVHALGSAGFSTAGGAELAGLSLIAGGHRYRVLSEEREWGDGDFRARLGLDRVNVKFAFPFADLTVGRQAITFGQAWFWNPLDVFSPFDPRSFDRDYKPGVDALRLDVPLGDFGGCNVVAVGGGTQAPDGGYGDACWLSTWTGSALLGRVYGTVAGWDAAVQGGKVYGGYEAGAGASGEAGPLEARGEVSWFFSKASDSIPSNPSLSMLADSFTGVAGLGRRLTDKVSLEGEYLYNGAGLPGNLDAAAWRVATGNALHMGRHIAGFMVSWEATALLKTRLTCIYSFSDRSAALQPGLTYSVSDESELSAGAAINSGRRPSVAGSGLPFPRSEFGSNPDVYYIEYKVYF